MRTCAWALTAVALSIGVMGTTHCLAQEQSNPEQLKKMYGDALAQLKAAQDRKNELATQNEQLAAKVAELQKQLDQARGEMLDLQRQDAENAEKNFYLRSHHAVWLSFVERYPDLKLRWKQFLEKDLLAAGNELPTLADPIRPLTRTE